MPVSVTNRALAGLSRRSMSTRHTTIRIPGNADSVKIDSITHNTTKTRAWQLCQARIVSVMKIRGLLVRDYGQGIKAQWPGWFFRKLISLDRSASDGVELDAGRPSMFACTAHGGV